MSIDGHSPNLAVLRNTGVLINRMGIEMQGSGLTNCDVEDNHFSHFNPLNSNPFGLSIVPSSGPNITIRYNTILGRPATDGTWTNRYGFGVEICNDDTTTDNFIEGDFWHGIVIGGTNVIVSNNVLRGPSNGGYQQPSQIAFEPGSNPLIATVVTNSIEIDTSSYIDNPDQLSVTGVASNEVDLPWVDHAIYETDLDVQRRVPGGSYQVIATLIGNATSFSDLSVAPKTAYVYRIRAFNSDNGDETYSPAVLVTTPVQSYVLPQIGAQVSGNYLLISIVPSNPVANYSVQQILNMAAPQWANVSGVTLSLSVGPGDVVIASFAKPASSPMFYRVVVR